MTEVIIEQEASPAVDAEELADAIVEAQQDAQEEAEQEAEVEEAQETAEAALLAVAAHEHDYARIDHSHADGFNLSEQIASLESRVTALETQPVEAEVEIEEVEPTPAPVAEEKHERKRFGFQRRR